MSASGMLGESGNGWDLTRRYHGISVLQLCSVLLVCFLNGRKGFLFQMVSFAVISQGRVGAEFSDASLRSLFELCL